MSECSLTGLGQVHVSNFYIVNLENFAAASRLYTGDIHNSVRSRFVYHTYRTIEATRSRHAWLHMFITHRPSVTLQLHNFDLFRTWRTGSFCTVAWQLARFQLTRRIVRSLGDSWASCCFLAESSALAAFDLTYCWHCLYSIWQGLRNGTVSICLSVAAIDCCSCIRWVCCCVQEISIDCCMAGTQQQWSQGRLNTVLFSLRFDVMWSALIRIESCYLAGCVNCL